MSARRKLNRVEGKISEALANNEIGREDLFISFVSLILLMKSEVSFIYESNDLTYG